MKNKKGVTYKDSGVDIDEGAKSVELISKHVNSTHDRRVLGGIGAFGGLFDISDLLRSYKNPVLVQSIDGVGTKLMVATLAKKHTTVGIDIVNHGCNDILCQGAKGITFLDYIAMSKLSAIQVEEIMRGMASACKEAGIAILGGETAELPGMYRENEYDIAGIITGVVERERIVNGRSIKPGDVLVGLASNGLHTNGYTLARKVFFDIAGLGIDDTPDRFDATVGESLLRPHTNYAPAVLEFLENHTVEGMAHITGGGIAGNLIRILPEKTEAVIKRGSWPSLPVFDFIREKGEVPQDDMDRAFNNGIGFIIVMNKGRAESAIEFFNSKGHPAFLIGDIVEGERGVRFR
ncbi:MAG: phosphoribosylformylglycinamidine cyclo-ligase [Nitrospinota bacterium]|nr:phosphoribosylformylglycinamidine cyclo-ligase [Nitrospinota bacterium]